MLVASCELLDGGWQRLRVADGSGIGVYIPRPYPLLQASEIRDDVGDLLVREPAGRHSGLHDRIVLALSLRVHDHAGLHLSAVLDPERHVAVVIREESAGDGDAGSDVREVRSDD